MRRYKRSKEPAKNAGIHPSVLWIWREMNHQRASQEDVAARAGISSSAMRHWRNGNNSPKIADIEAVINVLGGKLVIKRDNDDYGTPD